jgi:hypothetical protein
MPSWQDSGTGRVSGLQHSGEIGIVATFGMTSGERGVMSRVSKTSPLASSPGGRRHMLRCALPRYAGLRVLALAGRDIQHAKAPKFVSVAEIGHASAANRPQARPFGKAKPNERPDPGGSR